MARERSGGTKKAKVAEYVVGQVSNPGWVGEMLIKAEALWDFVRDGKMPWKAKALIGVAILYAVSPVDLIPDTVPVLGQLDDLAVVLGAAAVFNHFWGGLFEEKKKGVRERRKGKNQPDDEKNGDNDVSTQQNRGGPDVRSEFVSGEYRGEGS